MPLREFSFALIALASQARSGLSLFQPQPFAPKFSCPSGCRFSNHLLPGRSDIPQQRSLTFRSPVLPASVCASQIFRAKWMPLQNCNLAVFRSPCPSLLIQLVPPQCGHLHIPFRTTDVRVALSGGFWRASLAASCKRCSLIRRCTSVSASGSETPTRLGAADAEFSKGCSFSFSRGIAVQAIQRTTRKDLIWRESDVIAGDHLPQRPTRRCLLIAGNVARKGGSHEQQWRQTHE